MLNEDKLPIGIHHGSLSKEARRKVEGAMARGELRALVCTASLDLGVDWGDIDMVVQMGAPKGSSRLLQRIGRANHRLDSLEPRATGAGQPLRVPGSDGSQGRSGRRASATARTSAPAGWMFWRSM